MEDLFEILKNELSKLHTFEDNEGQDCIQMYDVLECIKRTLKYHNRKKSRYEVLKEYNIPKMQLQGLIKDLLNN